MKSFLHSAWPGAISCGIWLCFVIPFVLLFLTSDRGLEMTDEASYLLIAQDPWGTRGHGTFFGFALHPLWQLSGEGVASFRRLGFFLGVAMACLLARAVELRIFDKAGQDTWFRPALYGSLLVASLGIYVDGIRTPSYNWLAWGGAGLFLASLLAPGTRGWREAAWALTGGFGLGVLVLGKWGAALLLVAVAAVILLTGKKNPGFCPQVQLRFLRILGFGLALLLGCFFWIGWQGLTDTLEAGLLISRETGSHGFWLIRKYAWELFYYGYRLGRAFVWIIPLAWGVWWCWRKILGRPPVFSRFGPVVFLMGSALALARGYGVGGTLAFSKESIIAGGWCLGLLWLAWKTGGQALVRGLPWRWIGLCFAAPFLLGAGTNTSLADYAGHGSLFLLVGGWLIRGRGFPGMGSAGWLAVLFSVALLQGVRVGTSLEHSYRIGSVWEQSVWLRQGPEKERLRVKADFEAFLARLNQNLDSAGFRAGDPVTGISDLCGIVYLAGGRSPGVPWFFGQSSGQKPYTQAVLGILPEQTLSQLWVFRSTGTQLPGPVESFWPRSSGIPVPRLVAVVPRLPSELGENDLEIYKPNP